MKVAKISFDALRADLDRLYLDYNRVDSAADPIQLVRAYPDPADREIAGFLAAGLAFGRVGGLLASVTRVLAALGSRPAAFVRTFDPRSDGVVFRRLGHRWLRGTDLAALVGILQRMLREAGSIEAFFLRGYDPRAPDLQGAIESFSLRALAATPPWARRRGRPGVQFFFPRPSSGSGCKRINLFLRWMVRRDAVDLGVWRAIPPSKLVIPLDTHVIRVGQCLGLTRYRTPGWRMAAEITRSLRQCDPADPVKYDFALCRLGMSGECRFGRPRALRSCRFAGRCREGAPPEPLRPGSAGAT